LNKIESDLGSEWQKQTIELMKMLYGYKDPVYNEETNSIDYKTVEDNKIKVLRALINENKQSAPAYVDTVKETIEEIEDNPVDQVLLLVKSITSSARNVIKENENVDYLSPQIELHYRIGELVYAIQKKTMNLCKKICGKIPKSAKDCKGKVGLKYECDVRRISDDATFHATMKWNTVLMEDFLKLVDLEEQIALKKVN
jgi:hypothetical protein